MMICLARYIVYNNVVHSESLDRSSLAGELSDGDLRNQHPLVQGIQCRPKSRYVPKESRITQVALSW